MTTSTCIPPAMADSPLPLPPPIESLVTPHINLQLLHVFPHLLMLYQYHLSHPLLLCKSLPITNASHYTSSSHCSSHRVTYHSIFYYISACSFYSPSTCTNAVTPPLTMQLPPHSQMPPINPTVTPPTLPVINPPSQAQSPHVDTPSNQRLLDPEEVIDKYPKLKGKFNDFWGYFFYWLNVIV